MERDRQILDLIRLRKVLAGFSEDDFVVGLYINVLYSSQYEWLNALAEELRARGIVTIGLLTTHSVEASKLNASHFAATDYVAVIPSSAVKLLRRINVFVISDIDGRTHFPPTAKVLGCAHRPLITGPAEYPLTAVMHDLALLDGLMVTARLSPENRSALKKTWTGFVSPRMTLRSERPFQLIPVGYPRHAAMLRTLNKTNAQRDAIVYAPFQMDAFSVAGPSEFLEGKGIAIINFLLKNFPEYRVLFRPAPSDRRSPTVQQIVSLFHNEPRFLLDRNDDQVNVFSRGAALVTDRSSIADSFAYVTLRAGIYFQPWQERERPLEDVDCGFMAYTYDALRDALRLALGHTEEVSQRIRRNRDSLLMPIEGALDAIADWIQDFYNERARPDWVTIDRSESVLEPAKELIKKFAGSLSSFAPATLALFRNPDSPLLAAYALHVGRARSPLAKPHRDLLGNAGRLLGTPLTSTTYGSIPPEYILNLYALAAEEYEQQGDADGVALVMELLKDFNATLSKN